MSEIKVVFGDINKNNYEQLKQLNNLTLPVRYKEGFYYRIINKIRYGRFAYFNDILVSAITWKYDNWNSQRVVYIMTINVLDDYKRLKIGSQLLQELIRIHKNITQIKSINLHVQISNIAALNFYLKNGFENVSIVKDYYTDVEPKDAYFLRLKLND